MAERHIVAMGGGGFLMEPENPRLDDFVLSLTRRERPKVCFLPTAAGDSDWAIVRFYTSFPSTRCTPSHLSLFRRTDASLGEYLLDQDVVYVCGGNTANMLAIWREHGLIDVLRAAWERGVVLCGVSAGALCWFEGGLSDSFGPRLAPLRTLGFLSGSFCPHYDGEAQRRPRYHECVAAGELPGGWAADDGAALHFAGTELAEVVSSRPAAGAYRVEVTSSSGVIETRRDARFLDGE